MIAPPKTYAQWTALLKTFAEGSADEDVLHAMRTGTLVWQSGVAERFAQRFSDALNARMNRASDVFDRDMKRAADERAMIGALLALRRSLVFLHTAAALPLCPRSSARSSPRSCSLPLTVCRRVSIGRRRVTVRAGCAHSCGGTK